MPCLQAVSTQYKTPWQIIPNHTYPYKIHTDWEHTIYTEPKLSNHNALYPSLTTYGYSVKIKSDLY